MIAAYFKNGWVAHAAVLGLVWGFAEGTVFFIVPDVLISLIALFSLKRSVHCMGSVLAGSLAAGAVLYLFSKHDAVQADAVVRSVPFIREWMFANVQADYSQHGIYALLMGPSSGIPYKIYAIIAPAHASLSSFLMMSIPARLERFVLTWAIFAVAGYALRNKRETHVGAMLAGHMLYWAAIYSYYLTVVIHGQ